MYKVLWILNHIHKYICLYNIFYVYILIYDVYVMYMIQYICVQYIYNIYALSELFYSTRLVSGLTVAIRNLFVKRYTNGCIFYLNSFLVFSIHLKHP